MKPGQLLHPGDSTAYGETVGYRLGKIAALRRIRGRWLDCGCAEGDYTVALLAHGAREAVGADVLPERVAAARARWAQSPGASFVTAAAEELPFPDASFDAVLLNEVLEHVRDERRALREAWRVLTPGGSIYVFSPNRWFPFEGHGAVIGPVRLPFPVPLLPWLPFALTHRVMQARNWWPSELRALVASAGFEIEAVDYALPMFERYKWMPRPLLEAYDRGFASLERRRWIRRLGVSTLVVGARAATSAG